MLCAGFLDYVERATTGPVYFRHGCPTTRDSLWVFVLVGRAASRNTRYVAVGLGYAAAGPCTKMYLYEAAVVNLCCLASGYGGVQTVHLARVVVVDGVTPMEARFWVEMGIAASKFDRGQASALASRLLEKHEPQIGSPLSGSTCQECYDITTGKPSEAYLRLYDEVRAELAGMGVSFV